MTEALCRLVRGQLPRILTQVCRDPGSPFEGCWDRNWWHYKIRDFPSIIVQQGGYALYLASQTECSQEQDSARLEELAAASGRFWNSRARRHGAFEEYYPFEQGYPPLAFSTLAIAKLVDAGVHPVDDVREGFAVAIEQLLNRFEAQAANQQVAGTAAAAMIRKVAPEMVDEEKFSDLLDRTFALQHAEGWFPEYDGPDLGYLTVTMDCLWDIHDATDDPRSVGAIHKALDFIAWFIEAPPGRAGMHNSRNTDYLVPYAIARIAAETSDRQALAGRVFRQLYEEADHPDHFFAAVDDRYWCHYIGHSVLRAIQVLGPADCKEQAGTSGSPGLDHTCFKGSGHVRLSSGEAAALVSARKGGIATVCWEGGGEATDFGWIVRRDQSEWVTHWWSLDWTIHTSDDEVSVKGPLVGHKEHASSPLKHSILRLGSFLVGRRLIRLLKRLLIFKKAGEGLRFERTVRLDGEALVIQDRIIGLLEGDEAVRAPRSSKRHVASADSHHWEDFSPRQGVRHVEEVTREAGSMVVQTRFERN